MKYLQNLVKIPILDPVSYFISHPTPIVSLSSLSQEPPSFLLPGQLIEIELAKQVQLQNVHHEEDSLSSLVDTAPTGEQAQTPDDSVFDSAFGRAGFSEGFDFPSEPPKKDERFVTVVCIVVSMYN